MVSRIGKYKVCRTIAQGSSGKVKECIDNDGQRYAIKIIDVSTTKANQTLENIKREVCVLKEFSTIHPNICTLHKVLCSSHKLFLVFDYCETDLYELIFKKHNLSEDRAACYFYQICEALHALHSHSIAHRDIKPENILLINESIRISDFGLSRIVYNSCASTFVGTIYYCAPEILNAYFDKNKKYNAFKSDIWSLGAVLYCMLVGHFPFHSPDQEELVTLICSAKFSIPTFISDSAKNLLKRILVADPGDRISLAMILQHHWFVEQGVGVVNGKTEKL
ncbi:hypothetical protein P9112_008266 [Eukaryota sp. TZLM1-RC]